MGYEFRMLKVEHAGTAQAKRSLTLSLAGENLGVAPFYYDWPVEWALLDEQGRAVGVSRTSWDLRKWLPGPFAEQASIAFDVPPGTYELAIGIRDPWKDRPAIGFANDLPVVNGWTVVSKLAIEP
jgi:hypothetical protein